MFSRKVFFCALITPMALEILKDMINMTIPELSTNPRKLKFSTLSIIEPFIYKFGLIIYTETHKFVLICIKRHFLRNTNVCAFIFWTYTVEILFPIRKIILNNKLAVLRAFYAKVLSGPKCRKLLKNQEKCLIVFPCYPTFVLKYLTPINSVFLKPYCFSVDKLF